MTAEEALLLANVEAIAQNEGGGTTTYTCEKTGVYKKGYKTFMCDTCDWNENTAEGYGGTGSCTK